MKKNQTIRYKTKQKSNKKTYKYEKNFFIRLLLCMVIFAIGFTISKIDNTKFSVIKSYIITALDESTDLKKTEKDIVEVFGKIKSKFGKNNSIPVDNFKSEESPMAKNKNDNFIMNAKASTDLTGLTKPDLNKPEIVIMRNPADGVISSVFGMRTHPVTNEVKKHNGIDIAGNLGDTVIAAASGEVVEANYDEFNGYYCIIKHNNDLETRYAHLDNLCVIKGEIVDDNTKIGEMGSTGLATGVHLHFEVKFKGEKVNPEDYVTLPHQN